jgi:hypothetical protein
MRREPTANRLRRPSRLAPFMGLGGIKPHIRLGYGRTASYLELALQVCGRFASEWGKVERGFRQR